MPLEAYFDPNGQLAMPVAVPSKGNGNILESSSSGISHKKEGYPSTVPIGLPLPIVRRAELNANLASGNENSTYFDRGVNAVGASSLVADTNFFLPSGAFLERSGSANVEPYLNLPSSSKPFSFSNLSSLFMDASSVFQQNTFADQSNQQGHKRQKIQKMAGPVALIEPKSQNHLLSLPIGMKQDPSTLVQVQNKPRDMNPDDLLQQQIVQQLLLGQDIKQWQDNCPELEALIHHHRQIELRQQISHSTTNFHEVLVQQSEEQIRNRLRLQATLQNSSMTSSDDGICSRRLTQYLYNFRNRPQDNNLDYWRKFVSEFYAPVAKERWCLSSYENIGQHVLGVLSFGTMGAWCCDICGTKSGKGFEATYEILPRLCKMKFESGAVEEILFLEFPRECKFPSGIMMLEYGKAVQEIVHEQFRVIREGKLRVIFRHDLKILSWEFCAHHHEVYLPRRLVAPQVNEVMHTAHKYQSSLRDSACGMVSREDLQENCNMFYKSEFQLAMHMDIPMLNDLGFPKRHVRSLQIAEVFNIMKDLMDFSTKRKTGPIESLQTYPRAGTKTDIWRSTLAEQETMVKGIIQNMETDGMRSTAIHLGPESHSNDTRVTGDKVFSGSGDVGSEWADYYQKLPGENLSNTIGITAKPEQSYLMGRISQRAFSLPFVGQSYNPELLHNSRLNSLPTSQTSEASKDTQQDTTDRLLQDLVANSRARGVKNAIGMQHQVLHDFNSNIISGLPRMARDTGIVNNGPGFENCTDAIIAPANFVANASESGSIFRTASNSNSLKISGNKPTIKREPDLPEFLVPEAYQNMG